MERNSLAQRYWSKVDIGAPDECWPWTGASSQGRNNRIGYGCIRIDGRTLKAHRVGWELAHGASPGEMLVRHTCDYPLCQNPSHLLLGTGTDNMRDMYERRRNRHSRGEEHPRSRLTIETVKEIRALHNSGVTKSAIARELGIPRRTVHDVLIGRTWRHIE
jgi:hypothetical protein